MSSNANNQLTEVIRHPVEPVPTHVNGLPVLAATKIKPGQGEYPDQWVVICDWGTEHDRYVVWYTYLVIDRRDDRTRELLPPMLAATQGYYTSDPDRAMLDFADRVAKRGLAER